MTLERPLFMEPLIGDPEIDYTAYNFRALIGALWNANGVLDTTSLIVSPRAAGANMSVDVGTGTCVIQGSGTNQRRYLCVSTAVTNVAIPAAPGSGSRLHRLIARIYDKQWDANSNANPYSWNIELLADTGSGTPALPANAVTLAIIDGSAGVSAINAAQIQAVVGTSRDVARLRGVPAPPLISLQSAGDFPVGPPNATWHDFGWFFPEIDMVIPPSGMFHVTITGEIRNTNTASSSAWMSWRVSGAGATGLVINGDQGISAEGNSRFFGSQRLLCIGVPGQALTITPRYQISSGDDSTTLMQNGVLEVEFV